jgi:transposase InsO family protein
VPSRATINRVLDRRGQLVAVPQRRPRAATRRFRAAHPNTCWQMDGFQVSLSGGVVVVVLHIVDDSSSYDIALRAAGSENAADVWDTFVVAVAEHGLPRQVLTDNGVAFSGRRRGWLSTFEQNLTALGVKHITSSTGHPQTCGKCERAHRTALQWLRKRSFNTIEELDTALQEYRAINNGHRRRRHLDGLTPAQRYQLGPKDAPSGESVEKVIVHTTQVGTDGTVTMDTISVGVGRRYSGSSVTYVRRGKAITIFNRAGLIAEFELTARAGYQSAHAAARLSTKS